MIQKAKDLLLKILLKNVDLEKEFKKDIENLPQEYRNMKEKEAKERFFSELATDLLMNKFYGAPLKEFEEFLNYLRECVKYTPLMASSAELTRINEEFYKSKFRNNE